MLFNQNKSLSAVVKYSAIFFLIQTFALRTFVDVNIYAHIYLVNTMTWFACIFTIATIFLEKKNILHYRWFYVSTIVFLLLAYCIPATDSQVANKVFLAWLTNISLFFCCCYWVKDEKIWNILFAVVFACFCMEVIHGLYRYYLEIPATQWIIAKSPQLLESYSSSLNKQGLLKARIFSNQASGHFSLANTYAMYLFLFIPCSIGICIYFFRKKSFIITGAILSLSLWSLYLTKSRGVICSFVLASFLILLLHTYKYRSKISLVFLIFSAVISFFMVFSSHLNVIGDSSLTFLSRLEYWKVGGEVFQQHYLSGVGLGNFSHYFYQYKPIFLEEANNAHNFYLQYAVETGVAGFFVILIFVLSILRELATTGQARYICRNIELTKYFLYINATIATFFMWQFRFFEIHPNVFLYLKETFGIHFTAMASHVFVFGLLFIGIYLVALMRHCGVILRKYLSISLLVFCIHAAIDVDFYIYNLNHYFWFLFALYIAPKKSLQRYISNRIKYISLCIICVIVLIAIFAESQTFEQEQQKYNSIRLEKQYLQASTNRIEKEHQYLQYLYFTLKTTPNNIDNRMRFIVYTSQKLYTYVTKESQRKLYLEREINTLNDHIHFITSNSYLDLKLLHSLRHVHITLGKIWFFLKKEKKYKETLLKALGFAKQAIKKYPYKASLLFKCGQIYHELGQDQQAFALYQKALFVSDMVYPPAYGLDNEDREYILSLIRKRNK